MEKKQSDPRVGIREWLKGKTVEDLDIIENGNRLLFSDSIKRIGPKNTLVEEPVRVQIPRPAEALRARAEAVALAKKAGLDRDKDSDQFEMLDIICELSYAVREPKAPYDQKYTAEQYLGSYDYTSLFDLYHRVKVYRNLTDPRISEPSVEDVISAACQIAEMKNISPLVAIGGAALDGCIITMASLLVNLMTGSLSSQSPEISTPAS